MKKTTIRASVLLAAMMAMSGFAAAQTSGNTSTSTNATTSTGAAMSTDSMSKPMTTGQKQRAEKREARKMKAQANADAAKSNMSPPDGQPGGSSPKMGATSGMSNNMKTPTTDRKGTGGVGTTGTAGSAPDGRPGASSPKMGATSGMSTEMKTPTTQRQGTTPGAQPDGAPGAGTAQPTGK